MIITPNISKLSYLNGLRYDKLPIIDGYLRLRAYLNFHPFTEWYLDPNMEYQLITLKQLQALLAEIHGAKIITMITITDPDLKKDCPHKNIVKITRTNGVVNFYYEKAVNRQREREGKEPTFQANSRSWGTRLNGLPFVSHVNRQGEHKLYLEVKVEKIISTEYKNSEGKIIPESELEPFFKKSFNRNQQLDKEVVLRDYDVRNIVTIDIDKQGYILIQER